MTDEKVNIVKDKDFIDLEFTGSANGDIFDSNIPLDLAKINPEALPQKTIISVGSEMVVKGLDSALIGKEVGKQYEVHVLKKDAFGERKRELVKTIPLKVFTEQKINPRPGATLFLDNHLARIITVSGARVITDFNNPLAGKDLDYKFTIKKIITDEREKVTALLQFYFKAVPDFTIQEKTITVKGPKPLEQFIQVYKDRFSDSN